MPDTSAVAIPVRLTGKVRRTLTRQRDALQAARVALLREAEPVTGTLEFGKTGEVEVERNANALVLEACLQTARSPFERTFTETFNIARKSTRKAVEIWTVQTLASALAPACKSSFLRERMVRRSEPYRKLMAVFDRDEYFSELSLYELLGQAATLLSLCDGLLAGAPLLVDEASGQLTCG